METGKFGPSSFSMHLYFQIFVPVSWICALILNIPLFLTTYFEKDTVFCREYWPREWLPKAYSLTWLLVAGIIPVLLMAILYSRVVHTLWVKHEEGNFENAQQVCCSFRVLIMMEHFGPPHTQGKFLFSADPFFI